MAKLSEALKIAFELEHGSNERALHQNSTESGLTFCGIYEVANPTWTGWSGVKSVLAKHKGDMKKASIELMQNTATINAVEIIYRAKYWDKMKGDSITSQHIANEIFIFGINVGMINAMKSAQRCVGVSADGVFGNKTLEALNNFDEDKFSIMFDDLEISYYNVLASKNPKFSIYLNGWTKRAKKV